MGLRLNKADAGRSDLVLVMPLFDFPYDSIFCIVLCLVWLSFLHLCAALKPCFFSLHSPRDLLFAGS